MATGRDIDNEYREQLECGICLDIVKAPKSLPCSHTFCVTCLDDWINTNRRNRKRKFSCPTCKDSHDIPQNGANAYKTNVMLQGIVDIVERKRKLNEGDTVECDICIQKNIHSPVLARCMECAENMCQTCKRAHGLSQATKSHKLYKLRGNADNDSTTGLAQLSSRDIDCAEHPDQPLLFFCKDDKIPVCRDCCTTEHSKHDCVKIETILEAEKERIADLVELINEKKRKYERAINYSVNVRETQKHKTQTTLNQIRTYREEQLKRVNDHFDSLESKVREGSEANDIKIQAHQNELTVQKVIADSTLLHLSTLQNKGHPVDILNASSDISQRLQEWTNKHDVKLGLLSTQTFQQGHLDTSKLGQIVSSSIAAQVPKLPTPTLCQTRVLNKKHITGPIPRYSTIFDAAVGADLVIVHDKTETQTQLATYDNGTLTLKHQTVGSFNRLCALPGNQYAATDFLNKCVAIFNDKLVHQRNIGRFERPCGICCNAMNELIVSDAITKEVYHIDINDGSKLAIAPSGLFEAPQFVTRNSKGEVIVSDTKTHSITGITRIGDMVFSYGQRGSDDGQFTCPCGICTDALDNIIVADDNNNRVHLLDSSGRFIRFILTAEDGLQNPCAVAIDKNGDLVIGTDDGDVWIVKYMNYE